MTDDASSSPSSPSSPSEKAKGKAKAVDPDPRTLSDGSCLLSLPAELIASILFYLAPADLDAVSETCRALYRLANDDRLWQAFVQGNVPGQRVTSPFPFLSFGDLFRAHEPRWFIPRYKIWFSDAGLPGRMIIARYDQRRGCIEGYQLLANNTDEGHIPWQPDGFDSDIQVSAFAPEVRLHLDNPVLRLPANTQDEEDDEEPVVMHLEHRQTSDGTANGNGSILNTPQAQASRPRRQRRFQTEIHMRQGSPGHLRSSFFHARCLTPEEFAERSASEFPYGSVWPPPSIPSRHRVMGAGLHRPYFLQPHDSALSPLDVHDCAFRIMKWLQMRELWFDPRTHPGIFPGIFNLNDLPSSSSQAAPDNNRPMMLPVLRTTTVGDEIATYATLDPDLYTPTPSAPFRGIWVGDYGPHGCEFVWIDQYQDQDPAAPPPDRDSMTRFEGESEEAFAARKREAAIYRGSLMAVKLTGDPNVPRGEITFHAADLGEHGFVRVEKEPPFAGVRVVRSNGHVAHEGFANDAYIDGELLLISPDRLAHHWIDMERVNYFHRVDIDRFLVPE